MDVDLVPKAMEVFANLSKFSYLYHILIVSLPFYLNMLLHGRRQESYKYIRNSVVPWLSDDNV